MRLLVPPGFKTIHGELGGVVGGPDEDRSEIRDGTRFQRPLLAVVLEERNLLPLLLTPIFAEPLF